MPCAHAAAAFHPLPRQVKREQNEHHRDDEMVGNHGRKHYKRERETEQRHERGHVFAQSDDVAQYATEEYHGVETEEIFKLLDWSYDLTK